MPDLSKYRLSFSDEFSGANFATSESSTWKSTYYFDDRTLPGNGERELYVDPSYNSLGLNPFSMHDGALTITAQRASSSLKPQIGNLDFTSGLISSEQSFSMQYGYFEMR